MATLVSEDPKHCQCSDSPICHSSWCTYGKFNIIKREDVDYDPKDFVFKVPKDEDGHYEVTDVHIDEHNMNTCPYEDCKECREKSRRLHDHTRSIPDSHDKKFHGILQVTEEMILAGLGIYDENVQIKRIETPFGRNCIQIHITSPEEDVEAGNGQNLRLYKVREGAEVPVVSMTTDVEQEENIVFDEAHNQRATFRIKAIGGR